MSSVRPIYLLMTHRLAFISSLASLFITPVSAKDPSPEQLVHGLRNAFQLRHEQYTQAKPAAATPLEGESRIPALNHLRALVEMEDLLRQLREDKETRLKQVDTELLGSSEQKRVLDLRNEALHERFELLIDPPKRPSVRDQERLLKGFESKSRGSLTKESKARKELDKIYAKDRVDEDEQNEQSTLVREAQEELAELRLAFFGSSASLQGYEHPFASVAPGPAEDLLAEVIKARDEVLKDLRVTKAQLVKNTEGQKEAVISGITVKSENLGVILDNSSSMTPFIQPLRDEISKDFPDTRFRECYGCALNWNVTGANDNRSQVILFMEDLIIVEKVDAIYWFSDLKDPITPAGLNRLSQLRNRGKASLYVLSVGNKPSKELEPEIDSFSQHKGK